MSAADVRTHTPARAGSPDLPDPTDPTDPTMPRLTLVELRKCVDTRAGRWLLGTIVLVSLGMVALQVLAAPPEELGLAGFLDGQQLGTGVLLPVVGILAVTSEWSQRSAMTTFALVPRRHRVAVAKILAAAALALAAFAVTALLAVAGTALSAARADTTWAGLDWSVEPRLWPQLALLTVIGVLGGVAFGMALLSSPLAIVLYFLLPTVFGVVTELVDRLREPLRWVDVNATGGLMTTDVTAQQWTYVGTSLLLWLGAPMLIGFLRLSRREVA